MSLARLSSLAGAAFLGLGLLGSGCGDEGPLVFGHGGSGGAASSTIAGTTARSAASTSSAPSTSSTTGNGGASATVGSGGGGGEPVLQPSGYACSGAKPSITAVAQITSKNCASATCHPGMATPPEIYNSLVGVLAEECVDNRFFVKPGDPEHSYVINKITDHNLCGMGVPMPNGGTPLVSADIQTIYDWICSGAPDK